MYIAPANIGSWGLNYKTLRARNLRKIDRFRSKVVPFPLLVFFNVSERYFNKKLKR